GWRQSQSRRQGGGSGCCRGRQRRCRKETGRRQEKVILSGDNAPVLTGFHGRVICNRWFGESGSGIRSHAPQHRVYGGGTFRREAWRSLDEPKEVRIARGARRSR